MIILKYHQFLVFIFIFWVNKSLRGDWLLSPGQTHNLEQLNARPYQLNQPLLSPIFGF